MRRTVWSLILVVFGTGVAQGAVRYVSSVSGSDAGTGASPTAPCKTIQRAVNVSASGDEIRIATYDVHVGGLPPTFQTNTCTYTNTGASVISLTNGRSLTLKGGYIYVQGSATWQQGAVPAKVDWQNARRCLSAVVADNDTNHITLLEFVRGAAGDGANVFATGGSLGLVGTPIHEGMATIAGGGVYLSNVMFTVSLGSYSNLALPQMTGLLPIYSNSAACGGGLFLDGGNSVLTAIGIVSNTATGNGGGVFVKSGTPSVAGVTIRGNTSGGNGGGIYLSNSVALSGGMIVSSNRAVNGGGVHVADSVAMYNCLAFGNTVTTHGGGVFVAGAGGVYSCTIVSNTATVEAGGIYASANAG